MKMISYSIKEALQDGIKEEELLKMYRKMFEMRSFEKKVEDLYLVEGILIGPCHLYLGHEAVAVGSITTLKDMDLIVSTYRGHGHAIARSVPMKMIMAELFGRATGTCRGIGGSMHAAMYPEKGVLYATAIVGSGIPIAVGVGLGFKHRKEKRIVFTYFGDGAVNTGAFHEGLNLASIWKLPVIFICENNRYAMSTAIEKALAGGSAANRAQAYGMKGLLVDGNDVLAVYKAAAIAREHVTQSNGPVLIECLTYRQKGHGVYDKAEYRSVEEVEEWLRKDPVVKYREELLRNDVYTSEEIESIENEVKQDVDDAVKFAIESPFLPFDDLTKFVQT